ncbi:hypothetical protein BDR26DRAFT_850567 [Obelidium mucronatum]|nr:hypothetical protein BDR26DRAFT_850567 [Obelidium mucronatum]
MAIRFASMSIPSFITLVVCISILILSGGIAMIIVNRPLPIPTTASKEKVDALLYNQRFYPGQKVKAQFAYERNLSDELNVMCGDEILIKMIFDDNWCLGRNTSTNEEGTFPMLCLHTTLEIEKLKKRMSSKLVTIA